jgi:hypothetical protein
MSLSNPTQDPIMNPSEKWFQWDSTSKQFKYYDKEAVNEDPKKTGANVMVALPFKFIVIDVLTTIAGFSDADQKSVYSNEVRNYIGGTKVEIMEAKIGGKVIAKGTWESIKVQVEAAGGKFANSIYIAYFNEKKELKLGNIKLYGAPIGAWIETNTTLKNAGKKVAGSTFKVEKTKPGSKGAVKWNEPIFDEIEVSPETMEKARLLDVELQKYLTEYLATPIPEAIIEVGDEPAAPAPVVATEPDDFSATPAPAAPEDDGLPF